MKRVFYFLPILLFALACTPKASETTTPDPDPDPNAITTETPKPAPPLEVKLLCRELRGADEDPPLSEVYLQIGNQKIAVDSCNACADITQDMWEAYKIPNTAKAAVGGWWAGGGDYFYLAIEGNDAVVRLGYADEGAEEEDLYQYNEIARVKIQ